MTRLMEPDATPPPGEWTDFFLAQIAERDFEIGQLRNEISQRDAVLHWLGENNHAALDLCPWKCGSGVYSVPGPYGPPPSSDPPLEGGPEQPAATTPSPREERDG